MRQANCCTNLNEVVDWFKMLKADGVKKEEVLDVLEFDSDQYPDYDVLQLAREIVWRNQ